MESSFSASKLCIYGVCDFPLSTPSAVCIADLKPQNILLQMRSKDMVLKVADFGCAKILTSADAAAGTTAIGTFASVEFARGVGVCDVITVTHLHPVYPDSTNRLAGLCSMGAVMQHLRYLSPIRPWDLSLIPTLWTFGAWAVSCWSYSLESVPTLSLRCCDVDQYCVPFSRWGKETSTWIHSIRSLCSL